MSDLDSEMRAADRAHRLQHTGEGRLGRIVVEAGAARRDPPLRGHRGGLDDQQPGARVRQHAQMDPVPVADDAVLDAVLAHRRDDDAVGQGKPAQFDRRKQLAGHA
jgi:hypothetical protein